MTASRISIFIPAIVIVFGLLAPSTPCQTVLIPAGSTWKYLDDGSDQGGAWRTVLFDDQLWPSGPAQLGYGDGDEGTVVGYGPDPNNKYITTYFRHSFEVPDPSEYNFLKIRLLRDDGALVHLDSVTVVRSNMPVDSVDYQTVASSTVSEGSEDLFFETVVGAGDLVPGTNTLAVEIHQRSGTSSDISFDLELTGLAQLAHPIEKGPYLIYANEQSEMNVFWQLAATDTCTLEWGDDLSCSLGSVITYEFGLEHQHTHTFAGLNPSQKYYYRVIAREDTIPGTFHAAPASTSRSLKFIAYGDTRSNPADHSLVAEAISAAYTADPEFQTIAIVMGDLVYNGNLEGDWKAEFFDSTYTGIQNMLADLPFQSCRGNHEGTGTLFGAYFPYPYVSDFYWSFDYGPAHFIVIDQYVDYTPGSAQYAWLEADLAGTSKEWKIVYLHEPGWSAGGHINNADVQDYIQPLCRQYGVAIVFGGHNHYYARARSGGDIPHVTTGGGGAPLYAPDPGFPRIKATAMAHHFCKVEIDADVLTMTVHSLSDSLIDSITVANPTGVATGEGGALPRSITLDRVYPNPFNPATTIRYTLNRAGKIEIDVLDVSGRRVAILHEGWKEEGAHQISWDGTTLSGRPVGSGAYFVRLRSAGEEARRRLTVIR